MGFWIYGSLSVIQKEEDSFVKFKAMIYLLSDFFTAEILKGTMDIKGMQRSLEGATKQLLVSVDEDVIHIRKKINRQNIYFYRFS